MARIGIFWLLVLLAALPARADEVEDFDDGRWETTVQSDAALERGLQWLAKNQGPEGNWDSNDLGLVGMGALAMLAAGHQPGRSELGQTAEHALAYILDHAKPTGLLNVAHSQRDMYNHGLATFVLGQAYGVSRDERIGPTLDRALKLIVSAQCDDGGWEYLSRRRQRGHDLSLAVMQAKALRSAVDSGFDVPADVVRRAIKSVREHHAPKDGNRQAPEQQQRGQPGQFTYGKGGKKQRTAAMAAAGVVCLQEFGQYDDWRIEKNMDFLRAAVRQRRRIPSERNGEMPFDAYTLYYVAQALYQVGGDSWREGYPVLRDYLVATQVSASDDPAIDGRWDAGKHVADKPGDMYGTAVACFVLAIPNRYLPILQRDESKQLQNTYRTD